MVEFLTDAWLDAMASAATTVSTAPLDAGEASALTVRQIVTDGPNGTVNYDLHLDGGTITVDRSGAATPDVIFEQDFATAVRLVRGETHPHLALTGGQLTISGAAHRLTQWQPTLDALHTALADLRDETTW